MKPLHCPICSGEMVETSDHHGSWWEHQTKGGCILDHVQLLDDHDIHCWNRRAPMRAVERRTREIAENYPHGSDGRNTFVILADWISENMGAHQ